MRVRELIKFLSDIEKKYGDIPCKKEIFDTEDWRIRQYELFPELEIPSPYAIPWSSELPHIIF